MQALSEKSLTRILYVFFSLGFLLCSALMLFVTFSEQEQVVLLAQWQIGPFFEIPISFFCDKMSLFFATLIFLIAWLITHFSSSYLHKDQGFHRFFLVFFCFIIAVLIVILTASFPIFLVAWKAVSLCSVLLISFYHERAQPVVNAFYALVHYVICNMFFLMAALILAHENYFEMNLWTSNTLPNSPAGTLAIFLLILGTLTKSAQFPFCTWLAKAMEGPTSSSAALYGGISIHLGAFCLLRLSPFFEESLYLQGFIIGTGLLTVLYGRLVGSTRVDIKTQLAYASMTQVGLIYIEIGLGWYSLALLHIVGHMLTRTLQFLQSPSILSAFHEIAHLKDNRSPWGEQIYGKNFTTKLYMLSLNSFFIPQWLQRGALTLRISFQKIVWLNFSLPGLGLFWLALKYFNLSLTFFTLQSIVIVLALLSFIWIWVSCSERSTQHIVSCWLKAQAALIIASAFALEALIDKTLLLAGLKQFSLNFLSSGLVILALEITRERRTGISELPHQFGAGLAKDLPWLASFTFVSALSFSCFPPSLGYWGLELTLHVLRDLSLPASVLFGITMILQLISFFRFYSALFWGKSSYSFKGLDLIQT
ncbi:MAG: hypothetical protein KA436_08705 [Oligoflexales bacterium]|nr:hypothetical protein [Oligoflexales bacterium]